MGSVTPFIALPNDYSDNFNKFMKVKKLIAYFLMSL